MAGRRAAIRYRTSTVKVTTSLFAMEATKTFVT
jgi:hypothetical protein